jgi:hypothetical protein
VITVLHWHGEAAGYSGILRENKPPSQ